MSAAVALPIEPWQVYDAYVRGVMIDELVTVAGRSTTQIIHDIDAMRDRMRSRYAGITDLEADELRAIYLLAKEARKVGDIGSLRIMAELQVRHRDIITSAGARGRLAAARAKEEYQ